MLNPGAALCRTNGVALSNRWENGQSNSYEDIKECNSFGNYWPNEYFKTVLCFSASQASATIPTAQNSCWSRYQIGSESRDVCEIWFVKRTFSNLMEGFVHMFLKNLPSSPTVLLENKEAHS